LVRATFYTDCAKVKNGLALGVRVYAIVGRSRYAAGNSGNLVLPD